METRQPGLFYYDISSNLILPLNGFSRSFKGILRTSKSWGWGLVWGEGRTISCDLLPVWNVKTNQQRQTHQSEANTFSMLALSSCQIWNVMRLSNQHFYLMSLCMYACQKEPFLMYEKGDSSFIHAPRAETDGPTSDVMSSVIKTLAPVITHFSAGKAGCMKLCVCLLLLVYKAVFTFALALSTTLWRPESLTKVPLDKSQQHKWTCFRTVHQTHSLNFTKDAKTESFIVKEAAAAVFQSLWS